jgi:double-stranded uracil-DNA glycosylase
VAVLRDVLMPSPRVLFVGINPSTRSAEVGHHFAGRGNPFWRLLHASGLTRRLIFYEEDRTLVREGMALTNLCARATRQASELTSEERVRGLAVLERKIGRVKPEVVALVGVTLFRQIWPRAKGSVTGPRTETLSGARVFVLPNPSGLNASYPGFESKLVWFVRLRESLSSSRADS